MMVTGEQASMRMGLAKAILFERLKVKGSAEYVKTAQMDALAADDTFMEIVRRCNAGDEMAEISCPR